MVSEPQLPEDLSPILRHLEAAYPNEGCGLLLRNAASGRWRVHPMRNAYDEYRARDPAAYPRTSRTAYVFDSREQLRVWEMAEAAGERVACVFHSHTDAGPISPRKIEQWPRLMESRCTQGCSTSL